MRVGEILSLTWDKVSLKDRLIRLSAEDTKDHEARVIPICDELLDVLTRLPRGIQGNLSRFRLPREEDQCRYPGENTRHLQKGRDCLRKKIRRRFYFSRSPENLLHRHEKGRGPGIRDYGDHRAFDQGDV